MIRTLREHLQRKLFETSGWHQTADESPAEAIFIGGCGRSGTTLLREMLDRHSRIACGPESWLFVRSFRPAFLARAWGIPRPEIEALRRESGSVVRFAERFFGDYARRRGKARWADKSPGNVRIVHDLLRMFPNGKFIHLVRDGRDVVCSRRHHPTERMVRGKAVPCRTDNPIDACARTWRRETSAGLAYAAHPRCLEVRYERLVHDPVTELRRLCGFIGEPFEEDMLGETDRLAPAEGSFRMLNNRNALDPAATSRVGRWRRELSLAERRTFVRIAGELLVTLGYVADNDWARASDDDSSGRADCTDRERTRHAA